MHIPLLIFIVLIVLGIVALIYFTQKSSRADKKKWGNLK
jgi:hypothetical protein